MKATSEQSEAALSKASWHREEAPESGERRRPSVKRLYAHLPVFIIVDFLAVVATAVIAKVIYLDLMLETDEFLVKYLFISIALGVTASLFFEQMGMYRSETLPAPLIGFGKLWGGLALSFLVLLGFLYVFKVSDLFSRGWMLSWFVLSAITLVLARWHVTRILRARIRSGQLRHSVAIYGAPDFVSKFRAEYGTTSPLGEISGVYMAAGDGSHPDNINGTLDDLRRAMQNGLYDTIVIAMPASEKAAIRSAVKSLASYSAELLLCTDLEQCTFPVSGSRTLGNIRMDVINVVPGSERSRVAKACLDYMIAATGLFVLAPVLLLIAIAIKIDSRGPVFFRQRRYGQNEKIFRIFKFRTMTVAEDGHVVVQATKNDARVTRVGRILRRSSLDEVPQLLNVLLGDMSIVGPRPHAIAHDNDFDSRLDMFSRRRRVRPGITGWAQVNGWRGETKTIETIQARVQHDLYYIDNWSIWLDLEIIARTVMVAGRQAY
jgi:putative colanic acid biosynthesis UDP-glucose lipid carrier transferase